jgi:hypothetical protein
MSSVACPALQYFSTFSHKRHIFEKLTDTKCVFWFPLQHLSETFLILRRDEREVIKKCILVFMWSTTVYFCPIFMKLEFSKKNFLKSSNIKVNENPSSGSRVVPCGRTDAQDETNSRFSQFWERASKPVSERNIRIWVTFFIIPSLFFVPVYHNFLSMLSRCN